MLLPIIEVEELEVEEIVLETQTDALDLLSIAARRACCNSLEELS